LRQKSQLLNNLRADCLKVANWKGGVNMPKIEQKQVVINELKEKLDKAVSVVLVDARGVTVEQDTVLRKKFREANVEYKVYKNSIMRFAVKETPFAELEQYMLGPTAIAISYGEATGAASIIAREKNCTSTRV
jgi:large subunit ribosomal protein L10